MTNIRVVYEGGTKRPKYFINEVEISSSKEINSGWDHMGIGYTHFVRKTISDNLRNIRHLEKVMGETIKAEFVVDFKPIRFGP